LNQDERHATSSDMTYRNLDAKRPKRA